MKQSIYVFLRKDLDPVQQTVQAAHVCLEVGRKFKLEDPRFKIIIFGIRSETKLQSIIHELQGHNINHVIFTEPDLNDALTAIATEPLNADRGALFSRYRLLEHKETADG